MDVFFLFIQIPVGRPLITVFSYVTSVVASIGVWVVIFPLFVPSTAPAGHLLLEK